MLSILGVRLTIKVKVGIPESIKVGWYSPKKTGSSHLKNMRILLLQSVMQVTQKKFEFFQQKSNLRASDYQS